VLLVCKYPVNSPFPSAFLQSTNSGTIGFIVAFACVKATHEPNMPGGIAKADSIMSTAASFSFTA
jgi:hypothetical protein